MERNPASALGASMKRAEDTLGGIILHKTNPDFMDGANKAGRKRKKSGSFVGGRGGGEVAGDGDGDGGEGGASKKQKTGDDEDADGNNQELEMEVIDMPSPMEGKSQYSPLETVAYIHNMIENNPGKQYLRAYKEKMMMQKLIPIQKSQLNSLVLLLRR